MTAQTATMQAQAPAASSQEAKPTDKELNFRALEAKLAQERAARLEAEKRALEIERQAQQLQKQRPQPIDEDEEDDEPYLTKRSYKRAQSQIKQEIQQDTQSEIQKAVHTALQEERKQQWLKQNNDFYDVMQHAEKFAQHDPELAETILNMPEGFERQKLVYKNIKALGLHQPPKPVSNIQEKIDANRRSPYYQPSGVGTAPYNGAGSDFSPSGQKNAYQKMQELKARIQR